MSDAQPHTDDSGVAAEPGTHPGSGSYVVVARRYRPQTFDQLIGQQTVARAMRNAIQTDRVGHAYLFTGARGVGKTSAARILAKALNCSKGPSADPCNSCDICQGVASGDDVDVLEIDGASNRGIDEIRQLRSNVNIRPSRARYKIYIIDEVHMLTREAFNALLKTLEEPPEHVKFVFCTTDPGKIPITVLSRCQRYDFAPVDTAAITDRLGQIVQAEGAQAETEALQLLARRAAGSVRDSQSLLEQLLAFAGDRITVEDVHQMLGTARTGRLRALVEHLIRRDAAAALTELDAAVEEGVDVGQLTEQLLGYMRDMMAVSVGCGVELMLYSSDSDYPALVDAAKQWGLETILAATQILDQAVARMRQSVHVRMLAEMAVVRISRLEDLDALPDLIAQLKEGHATTPHVRHGNRAPSRAAQPDGPADVAPVKKKPSPAPSEPTVGPPTNDPPGSAEVVPVERQQSAGREQSSQLDKPPEQPSLPSSAETVAAAADNAWKGVTPESAEQIWRQALDHLNDMTADCGRRFDSVATFAPNRLVVSFKPQYNSSKMYCERLEGCKRLEQAVARVSGKTIRLEFQLLSKEPAPHKPDRPIVSARQRMRDMQSHPLVRQAIELFGAEVCSIDLPSSNDS